MKMIAAEVVAEEARLGAGGRQLRGSEKIAELVAGYEASGLSMAEYARREKLRYSTFAGWVKRSGARASGAKMTFARVQVPGPSGGAQLSVRLPSGLVLTGSDPVALAALVRALGKE